MLMQYGSGAYHCRGMGQDGRCVHDDNFCLLLLSSLFLLPREMQDDVEARPAHLRHLALKIP